jgi:hypothetical protein
LLAFKKKKTDLGELVVFLEAFAGIAIAQKI